MGILNVDNIQPVGGGTTITLNSSEINVGTGVTFESNGQANFAGIVTASNFAKTDGSSVGGASLTNGANNRVVTATGANALNGEANLTFDGNTLSVTGTTNLYGNGGASAVWGNTGYTGHLTYDGSNNAVIRAASGKALIFQTDHVNERVRIGSSGQIGIGGANYGTAGQVLTSQGASSAVQWATPSAGLSMADQWRFKATQNITGSRQLLTGWERPDRSGTGGGAYVGSGMSVSSDIFSFPATGIYLVTLDWSINCSSNNVRYAVSEIEVTKNNSDYYQAARAFIHINRPTGTSTGHTTSCNFIIDVDNTTNDKVKFTSSVDNVGNHQVLGDEDVNVTTVTFLRLGDT